MTHELPLGWTIRRPSLADVPDILVMVHASDIAAVGEADLTTDEVLEILTGPNFDPERDSWLAIDASGRVAGWVYLVNATASARDDLDVYVHPEFGHPARVPLLRLVLDRVAQRAAEFGHPVMWARAGAIATETAYVEALTAAGFTFIKRYARMTRELTGDERRPLLTDGLTIAELRYDDDAAFRGFHQVLDTAFRDTPDYQPCDFETYQRRLAAQPTIAWDEWFTAELDGVTVGILQSSNQGVEQNEAWVRNLAVAREHRARGIGAALLATAFATYAAKGRVRVGLGVDMTNPTGAYRLYESVGMRPAYEADIFELAVTAVT